VLQNPKRLVGVPEHGVHRVSEGGLFLCGRQGRKVCSVAAVPVQSVGEGKYSRTVGDPRSKRRERDQARSRRFASLLARWLLGGVKCRRQGWSVGGLLQGIWSWLVGLLVVWWVGSCYGREEGVGVGVAEVHCISDVG
jgi:hypothetical protein